MAAFRNLLDNSILMRRLTGFLIWISLIEWALAGFLNWVSKVAYVSHLSQLAITLSLIPWWQGLRVESRAPAQVAEVLVETTTLERIPGEEAN